MASYQAKQRDPLFDTEIQAMLVRRGRELIGLALLGVAIAMTLALGSYSPADPSWFTATDAAVHNMLGQTGASFASNFNMILGHGAWSIPLVLAIRGVRRILHLREQIPLLRIIFIPIAVALTSIYMATLLPGDAWVHDYGRGGLFGDAILGAWLNALPFDIGSSLNTLSFLFFMLMLWIGLYVCGFTRAELMRLGRFLLIGMVMVYAHLMTLLGKGARGTVVAARAAQARHSERRASRALEAEAEAEAPSHGPAVVHRPEPTLSYVPVAAQPERAGAEEDETPTRAGLLSRLSSLRKPAAPEPELVEPELAALPEDAPSEDRIKARIADVISARMRNAAGTGTRQEPPLAAGPSSVASATVAARRRGPQPLIAGTHPPALSAPPAPMDTPEDLEEIEVFDDPADQMIAEPELAAPPAPRVPMPQKAVVQHPARKPVQPSRQAKAEAQPALQFDDPAQVAYEHPPLSLLTNPVTIERHMLSDEALEENARMLENVLEDYGVKGDIVSVRPGPVVTMYELEPAPGLKASRVIGLADDIARSMSALSARVSTVPGRSVIGIELPNQNREKVVLREILASRDFGDGNQRLPLALGKDIGGEAVVANLAKMPHLLIAGTTGSGKSVAINTMILSLLYKLTPEECRLIMIDPKMLELSVYDGIPHLLSPVVTDPKKAVVALKWVVGEMEDRYRKMSKMGVRNIEGYNSRVRDALAKGEMFSRTVQTGFDDETGEPIFETEEFAPEVLPFIVVIVDEMADLMMVAGKEIEACIQRLAQMARASGIHLIMATQRPSVDVITGTIKANFPTRISFQVTSKVDSRTILGEQGAEQLLGMGDMLYMAGGAKITRVHGPFVSDEEVEEIVTYLKAYGPPDYFSGVVDGPDEDKESDIDLVLGLGGNTDAEDALYDTAVQIVIKDRKCSTSYIQRKLAIGYNKAARLVEQMEENGLVSPANHVGKREILVPEQG